MSAVCIRRCRVASAAVQSLCASVYIGPCFYQTHMSIDTSANNVVTKTVTSEQTSDQQKGNKMNPFTERFEATQANVFINIHTEREKKRTREYTVEKMELSLTVNMHSHS